MTIETSCAHCNRPMHMTVSSDMQLLAKEDGADPLVFMPQVDWETFTEPNIIHAY